MSQLIGVVGFRGYSGAELVGLLERHPRLTPVLLDHRSDSAEGVHPRGWQGPRRLPCTADSVREAGLAAVMLCTPHEVSMELTPELLSEGVKVVDLSGAFRLRTPEYHKRWYKDDHTSPDLLAEAAYGLPEFNRDCVRGARLVANPGCYPTAANLAIRPLAASGLLDLNAGIVCDAKSGISGAGRKPSLKTSFCESATNFSAYSILEHRHVPEVLLNSHIPAEAFCFTAQLLPIERGILETIYVRFAESVESAGILALYERAYEGEPFVRLYDPGRVPDLHAVQRSNFCDIGFQYDARSRRLCVVSAIDNLVKGAAGQALQNLNLMLGFPETEGLL